MKWVNIVRCSQISPLVCMKSSIVSVGVFHLLIFVGVREKNIIKSLDFFVVENCIGCGKCLITDYLFFFL